MTDETLVERYFLIPESRDKRLSTGEPHAPETWEWLHDNLWERFQIVRYSESREEGWWRDATGRRIYDRSRKYTVAIPDEKLDELRRLLTEACVLFWQECIYLNIGTNNQVELVGRPP